MGTISARTKAVRLQDDGKVLCKLLHVRPSSSLVPSSNFVFLLLPWSSGPQGGAGQMGSGGTRLFRKALFSCSCTLPVARNTSGTFPAGGSSPFWCTHLIRKTPHPCLREAGQSRMEQRRKSYQRKGRAHAPPSSTATEPLSAREQSGTGSWHHPPHTWQGLWCAERGTVPRGAKWHSQSHSARLWPELRSLPQPSALSPILQCKFSLDTFYTISDVQMSVCVCAHLCVCLNVSCQEPSGNIL